MNHYCVKPQTVDIDNMTNHKHEATTWTIHVPNQPQAVLVEYITNPCDMKHFSVITQTLVVDYITKTQQYEPPFCQTRDSSYQQYDQPQQLGSILEYIMTKTYKENK